MLKKPKKNGYCKLINQKTGLLKILKHYKNGFLHGKIFYYWDNGQIHLTGQYNQMHRIGTWKTYDSNGKQILEENYNSHGQQEPDQLVLLPINSHSRVLPLNPFP